jgi:hypothetical protein
MTTENNVAADANAASEGSTGVDSQLAEMHAAEDVQESGTQAAAQDPKEDPKDPKEGGEQAQTAAPEVKKVVPLAALHEERRARQELQRQIAERDRVHAEQMQRINQRLETLMPQQQVPARDTDPVGYLEHSQTQAMQQAVQQAVQPFMQAQQEQAQRQQQEQYVNGLREAVRSSAEALRQTTPDVEDAGNFVINQRARELMVLGAPEHVAKVKASQELDQLLMQWAHNQMNPAETAYEFAKARGYMPKAQQQATPAEKIAAQQKGVTAARSLGGGGAPNAGKLTAEALANMSDEEFSKLTDAQFKQALGG